MVLKGMCHTCYSTNVAITLHPKTSLGICKECGLLEGKIKEREKMEGSSIENEYD